MNMLQGLLDYIRVLPIVMRREILPYMLMPMALALLILVVLGGAIYAFAGGLAASAASWVGLSGALAVGAAEVLTWLILVFLVLLLLRYLLIIICSPILSIISERVEIAMDPAAEMPPFSLRQLGYGVWRGMRLALRNVVRELLLTVGLLALSLIPGMVFITSILLVVVQAYYIGFGHLDFALERRISIGETIRYVKQHRGYTVGNGLAYWLMLFIPVIGWLIALPLGAAAATYGVVSRS